MCIYVETEGEMHIYIHSLLFVELWARNSSAGATEQEFWDGEFLDMVIITHKADLEEKTLYYIIWFCEFIHRSFPQGKSRNCSIFKGEAELGKSPLYLLEITPEVTAL